MNNPLEKYKKAYEEIEIPEELAAVTDAAIQKGIMEQKRKKNARTSLWVKRIGLSAASLFILFTISINTIPAFASSLEKIPILGTLVKTLQFNKGHAGGGTITDRTDVNVISLHKQDGQEQIVIHFAQDNQAQQIASYFEVKYSEYPNMMSFAISGARQFSAVTDLEVLKKSNLIKDAYEIISPDDSLVRFNVVFNDHVDYKVDEYKEPAQVVLTIKPVPSKVEQTPVYAVRTNSFEYGESQSIYEEKLLNQEGLRVLKDQQGTYFVEAGYYKTEVEATAKLNELKQTYSFTDDTLFIERRVAHQIPQAMGVDNFNP